VTPKRIQMTRHKPWRADNPDAVVVARPSKWGNLWKIGDPSPWSPHEPMDRAAVIEVYRYMVKHGTAEIRRELAGRDLACWCRLEDACHADVLLEIANGGAA
jgi:hypothetical protein